MIINIVRYKRQIYLGPGEARKSRLLHSVNEVSEIGQAVCYNAQQILEQFRMRLPRIGWMHIKDMVYAGDNQPGGAVDEGGLTGLFRTCEEGEVPHARIFEELYEVLSEILKALEALGVNDFVVDLEPHLQAGGAASGFSGPENFKKSLHTLIRALDRANIVPGDSLEQWAVTEATGGVLS